MFRAVQLDISKVRNETTWEELRKKHTRTFLAKNCGSGVELGTSVV